MNHPHLDCLWIQKDCEARTESGDVVATFTSSIVAAEVIEDHNMGYEMEHPSKEEQSAKRTRDEEIAHRVAQWKEYSGESIIRPVELIVSACERILKFSALKTPPFLIEQQIDWLEDRVAVLRGLRPRKPDEVN